MTQSKNLLDLPEDMLGCVLYSLPLAHDIAATALTCRTFHASAKLVQKLRPFTGKIVTLMTPEGNVGHKAELNCVAAAPGGHVMPARTRASSTCGVTTRACAPSRATTPT